ncbi:MAG: hypothetical protein KDK45_04495 [Leptospiraceae bacterium]|nr:hypothetical protein [Leptospiraceae bacterium]
MQAKIIENSSLPLVLTYMSPLSWYRMMRRKPVFQIHAITLWPFVFCRGKIGPVTRNHESIHIAQATETLVFFFYIIYLYDWLKGLWKYRNDYRGYSSRFEKAYYRIRAEQEAYTNDKNLNYFSVRKSREWLWKYKV